MRCFTIDPLPETEAYLQLYLLDTTYEFVKLEKRPVIVIFPGGAYSFTADREAEPIAMNFLARGYQACVVRYSVRRRSEDPALGDKPLREAAAAIRYLRAHAEEWGIDPEKVIVCGFSAGGHLAGSIGVLWNDPERIPEAGPAGKPNAMLLSYAVCSAKFNVAHRGSIMNLTGETMACPKDRLYDLPELVGKDTAPAFLWHTVEDDCVPVENALSMALAMQRAKRPYALHVFTHGWHGLSLAVKEVGGGPAEVRVWPELAHQWLCGMGLGPEDPALAQQGA